MFNSASTRFLLWCLGGALLAHLVISAASKAAPHAFSPAFGYLLRAYDAHGNGMLVVVLLAAFALRRRASAIAAVRVAAERPWLVAAGTFPLLCLASLKVYHAHPVSMDEYATLFQAEAFAAGRLTASVAPDLLDRVIPSFLQDYFFAVSRASGEVSSTYWPSFALFVAPFAAAGIPWAANPALGALAIPALHRLVQRVGGNREAAGWTVLLAIASPVFVASSISFYAMQAHLLLNTVYALLLLGGGRLRGFAAGMVGALALTLHNPVPHLLFALPFAVWLLARRDWRTLAALIAGYVPLTALLGAGWHRHLATLAAGDAAPATAALGAAAASASDHLAGFVRMPEWSTLLARVAGLSKIWTWSAAGLLVLAILGAVAARGHGTLRVLAWSFLVTFFGYFLVRFDQGHGWGYRYIHSAWFVLPLLGGWYAARTPDAGLRNMIAWAALLSLALLTGLRMVQIESYVARHLAQVPPLARAPSPAQRELVFVNMRFGFYSHDLVQNDAFLRGPRLVMVYQGPADTARFVAERFPGFERAAQGPWGELWTRR